GSSSAPSKICDVASTETEIAAKRRNRAWRRGGKGMHLEYARIHCARHVPEVMCPSSRRAFVTSGTHAAQVCGASSGETEVTMKSLIFAVLALAISLTACTETYTRQPNVQKVNQRYDTYGRYDRRG